MSGKSRLVKTGTLKLEGAGQYPWHTGILCLRDVLVLVDSPAYNIRLYSKETGKLLATSARLQSQPWSIGMLDKSGSCIAVALWNGTIQILSIQSNETSTSIKSMRTLVTQMMKCYAVCSITQGNELVVTGPYNGFHCFTVLSSLGKVPGKLCKICTYGGLASFLATSNDELNIYVSCSVCHDSPDNGVYGFNLISGQCKFKYRRNLKLPRGICVDSMGYIYVCDQNTNCIHQVTEEGEPVAVFGELNDIRAEPIAICFKQNCHELFVTSWARNEVSIFQLIHDFNIPAEILRMDEGSLQMYKEALQEGMEKVFNIRVMVVGHYGVGKTTLTKRLLGEDVNIFQRKSTEGIDVHTHCCRVSLDTWEWETQHKEFLEVWLNSIHSIAPLNTVGNPPVVLVATHLDKIPEESRQVAIDRYFQQIRSKLKDQPTRLHLANRDFALDNTRLDPMLEDLKRLITDLARKQPFWGEEVPARWLPLEQTIMALKDSGVKIVLFGLVKELNESGSVLIPSEEELDLFLRFQHEKGTIVYFSANGLKDKIVLNPIWLIDALKSIITAKMFIYINNPTITGKWDEFEKNGKLTPELIGAVWTKESNSDFHENKEHILPLMEQLNIIAKPRSFNDRGDEVKAENYYIVPCMLSQATPEEVISPKVNSQMGSTTVLCYVFTEHFLPSPVFHRLLAACMTQWPVARKESDHLIFCCCSVFDLDHCHRLIVHFRNHVIFVRITRTGKRVVIPDSKLCIKVREYIDKTLSHIIGYLFTNIQYKWYIQCPRTEVECIDSMVPVSEMKNNAEILCKWHADHVIESHEVCKFWFETKEIRAELEPENPITWYPLDLQVERPTDQHLSRLSLRIGREFHILGLELGISEAEIQQIQIENPFVATQCFMILFRWAHRNVGQATFRNLERALCNVGADIEILTTLNEADDFMSCLSTDVLDIRPTEQELKKISVYIGKEFVHLGVELGIHLTRIEQIRMEFPGSVARQSLEILFVWRAINAGHDTFRNLERAFWGARMDANIINHVLSSRF